jgi:transposase
MHTIGIDMSKDTFHVAFDEVDVRIFQNSDSGIVEFIVEMERRLWTKVDTLIGTESTGVYHLLLCQKLTLHGWKIKVINPLLAHRMFKSNLRYAKTDCHDALSIRKILLEGVGYLYTDTPEMLALKALVQERDSLAKIRAGVRQRIHVHKTRQKASAVDLRENFSGVVKLLTHEIYEIEKEMGKYATETQSLLRSIPGVGKVTAASLIAYVGDINRFPSAKQLTAYIGLDLRICESGTSIHGKSYLTKRGNRHLRFVLFNAAYRALNNNPDLQRYFAKKISEGKHYFSAMCAVERKLVHLIYAIWKRGTPFEVH